MSVAIRLKELGLELPRPAAPVANYLPYKLVGGMLYISGQIPLTEGKLAFTGKLGAGVSLEDGTQCARLATLNALGWAGLALDGDLDRIKEVVRVRGHVASAPEFYDQAQVINGCSDLLVEVFGDRGRHSRAVMGCVALPLNAPVEIDFIFAVN